VELEINGAINNLYAALGYPPLPGWTASAGDPCAEAWQGVVCDATMTNIISINVIGANLGGELGDTLGSFSSLQSIDLSNNAIGGSIPTSFPVTITNIFLADNNFTGSLPDTLSSLTQLSALSLNDNNLSGEIPDSFEGLTALVNLDLSSNTLSGELPSSLGSLSSLTTFHLQNNKLSGTLDVLQDLPLRSLNIENNLFNGPIPDKLLSIPDFKKDGNPFNTTTTSAPPLSPYPNTPTDSGTPFFPSPKQPSGKQPPGKQAPPQASGPSSTQDHTSTATTKSWSAKKIVWVSIASVFGLIVLVLVCLLFSPRRRKQIPGLIPKRHEIAPDRNHIDNAPFAQPNNQLDKVPKVAAAVPPKEEKQRLLSAPPPQPPPRPPPGPRVKPQTDKEMNVQKLAAISKQDNNLIGNGMLGSVYRAQLPDGKLLAVKKLDKRVISQQKEEEFIELVNNLDKIRHANVVELMGSGTLQDALHADDDYKKQFSWSARIRIALGAARALDTRHRGEQLLVRWAVPQLHDIDALSSMVDPSLNGEYPVKSLSNFADIISRCVQGEPEFRPQMSEVVQDLIQMIRRETSVRTDRN
ncbi:hypothetical protein M8C21_031525, partial [Ambrosia artemisiifolia]